MKKRVLIVSEYFYPHWTGLAKFALLLGESLSKEYILTILTVQHLPHLKKKEVIKDLLVLREPYLFKISRSCFSLAILWRFIKIVSQYDFIFINTPNSNVLFFALLAKLAKKKVFIFHHGDLILPRKTGFRIINLLIERVFDVLTISSFLLADKILTPTEDYARSSRVMKFFLKKFTPFIVQYKPPQGRPSRSLVKKLESLKKKHILIGFAGRFVEEKGFDILLKSIPFVVKKIPLARFVFAGEINISYENFYKTNEALIDKHRKYLVFLGLLNEADTAFFYKGLSVFVIPSRSDCFPLTQIEAGLSRIPIVVTDIPGARVPVISTGFGEIAAPENAQSLARSIIEVVKNRNIYMKNHLKFKNFLKKYSAVGL